MELAEATAWIDARYAETRGYELSHRGRRRMKTEDTSFSYGEVTPPSVDALLQAVAPRAGETFCDLGAGTGKLVFLAALRWPFARCLGVELVEELAGAALDTLAHSREELARHTRAEVLFTVGDLLQAPLGEVGVAYVNAAAFRPPLVRQVVEKLAELPRGARAILIGHSPLRPPAFRRIETRVCEADWGSTVASIYARE